MRRSRAAAAAAALAALLLLAALAAGQFLRSRGGAGSTGSPMAVVTVYVGSLRLTAAGGASSSPLVSGRHLRPGDLVTGGPASKAAIGFADGSEVRMDGNSRLRLERLTGGTGGLRVEIGLYAGRILVHAVRDALVVIHGPGGTAAVAAGGAGSSAGLSVAVTRDPSGRPLLKAEEAGARAPGDQFAVFNAALDAAEAEASRGRSPAPAVGAGAIGAGQLSAGSETSVQPGIPVAAGASIDVVYSLALAGSSFELVVIDPDGVEHRRASSAGPSLSLVVPLAQPGRWQYRVHDLESPPAAPWVVIVSALPR